MKFSGWNPSPTYIVYLFFVTQFVGFGFHAEPLFFHFATAPFLKVGNYASHKRNNCG